MSAGKSQQLSVRIIYSRITRSFLSGSMYRPAVGPGSPQNTPAASAAAEVRLILSTNILNIPHIIP